jgi:hypothetical protein
LLEVVWYIVAIDFHDQLSASHCCIEAIADGVALRGLDARQPIVSYFA